MSKQGGLECASCGKRFVVRQGARSPAACPACGGKLGGAGARPGTARRPAPRETPAVKPPAARRSAREPSVKPRRAWLLPAGVAAALMVGASVAAIVYLRHDSGDSGGAEPSTVRSPADDRDPPRSPPARPPETGPADAGNDATSEALKERRRLEEEESRREEEREQERRDAEDARQKQKEEDRRVAAEREKEAAEKTRAAEEARRKAELETLVQVVKTRTARNLATQPASFGSDKGSVSTKPGYHFLLVTIRAAGSMFFEAKEAPSTGEPEQFKYTHKQDDLALLDDQGSTIETSCGMKSYDDSYDGIQAGVTVSVSTYSKTEEEWVEAEYVFVVKDGTEFQSIRVKDGITVPLK